MVAGGDGVRVEGSGAAAAACGPSSRRWIATMICGSCTSRRLTTWSCADAEGAEADEEVSIVWMAASRMGGKVQRYSSSYGTGRDPTCTRPQPSRSHQSCTSSRGSGRHGTPSASHSMQKRIPDTRASESDSRARERKDEGNIRCTYLRSVGCGLSWGLVCAWHEEQARTGR